MSLANRIVAEEQELGTWPRRLMHVPSMTSYEWQPGNKYGGVQCPEYSAITYTWGRWKLGVGQMSQVRAIDIRGVPWEIPRVEPSQFTVSEFENVISAATRPIYISMGRSYTTSLQFVWLDVACIDQRPNDPRAASEIGRQAAIFKGARNVLAWLPSLGHSELQYLASELYDSSSEFSKLTMDSRFADPVTDRIRDSLQRLFADPWFSSLWTLQEVFLRQDAVLTPRDGKAAFFYHSRTSKGAFHFLDLIAVYEDLGFNRLRATNTPLSGSLQICYSLAAQVGLSAIATQNAIMALVASSRRTTKREPDRVYGIQQIFGFRLGKTAPYADPSKTLTRAELEIELGRELLQTYPVHCQAHVFTAPVQPGQAWRVNDTSIVPDSVSPEGNPVFEYDITHQLRGDSVTDELEDAVLANLEQRTAPKARFSVIDVGGETWAHFDGKLCPLATINAGALQFEQHPFVHHEFHALYDYNYSPCFLNIHLDASDLFPGCPVDLSNGYHDTWNGRQQQTLALWLTENRNPSDIVVLILGEIMSTRSSMYGLILLGPPQDIQGTSCWRRVGFCNWRTDCLTFGGEELPGHDFFHGMATDWMAGAGAFG